MICFSLFLVIFFGSYATSLFLQNYGRLLMDFLYFFGWVKCSCYSFHFLWFDMVIHWIYTYSTILNNLSLTDDNLITLILNYTGMYLILAKCVSQCKEVVCILKGKEVIGNSSLFFINMSKMTHNELVGWVFSNFI